MGDFKVGDKVLFGRTYGEQTLGTVAKVNRKTVLVRQDESRGTMKDHAIGTKWKVPFSLCKPANGVVGAKPTRRSRIAAFFEDSKRSHQSFYAGLKVGSTVHYHNGFGEFVRCVVVQDGAEKKLSPVALVNTWYAGHDDHYRRMIANGETFTPHASNIYENPEASPGAQTVDPRGMEPLEFKGQLDLALGT